MFKLMKTKIAIIIIACLLILAGISIYLLLNYSNKNNTTTTTQSEQPAVLSINFDDEETGGCGDFYVYTGNQEQSKYITVGIPKDELNLKPGTYTFELKDDLELIEVKYEVFEPSIKNQTDKEYPYCNDIAPFAKSRSYKAKSGNIIIQISTVDSDGNYQVNIELSNVIFKVGIQEFLLKELEITDVKVGWLVG
jgi:outer membrane lipoprotein-sorting protein